MTSNVLRLSLAYLLLLSGGGKIAAFIPFRASLLRWPIRSFRLRSAVAAFIVAFELVVAIMLFLAIPSTTVVGSIAAVMGAVFLLDGAHAARTDVGGACHCMGIGQPRSPVTVARSGFVFLAGVIVASLGGGPPASPLAHGLGLAIAVVLALAPAALPTAPGIPRRVP